MINSIMQDEVKPDTWNRLIIKGMTNAITGISQMLGHEIKINSIKIGQVPAKGIPDIFGGSEALVIGIYLTFSGAANGHFIIAHQPELAYTILDMIRGNNPDISKRLNETGQAILGEMGNITGTFFLNVVRETLGVPLHLSAPVVLLDSANALLDIALAEILQEHDDVFIVESMLDINNKTVQVIFSIMLDSSLIQLPLNLSGKAGLDVEGS